ncbi:MAG: DUF5305 domain-containing protein [Oscillospiraceae bacterium]|nr:DUF5305 domain-containing protein [Oscillospiraceae bacterium]
MSTRACYIVMSVCGALLIASAVLAVRLFIPKQQESYAVSGNNSLNYTVYYVENEFFGTGKMPRGVNYLMPYTDYIEVTNGIDIKENTDLAAVLSINETFSIQYKNGTDDSLVYQEKREVANKKDVTVGNHSTIYVVDPWEHIDRYMRFAENRQEQTRAKESHLSGASYTAEVSLDFEYLIESVNGSAAREVLTRQIVIPLSAEVYKPTLTGESSFDLEAGNGHPAEKPDALAIVMLFLWFAALILIIIFCIRPILNTREKPHEADIILKKYLPLIIKSIKPLDTSGYKDVYVPEFNELVKLAAALNKNIVCYRYNGEASFCVYTDGLAYCYYSGNSPEERQKYIPVNDPAGI